MMDIATRQVRSTTIELTLQCFARKLVRPFQGITEDDIRNEIRALDKLCTHNVDNIVRVLRHNFLPQSVFYFIDMELCELNLDYFIREGWPADFSESRYASRGIIVVWDILRHIVNGLEFIHGLKEVHRDMKPRNSLLLALLN